MIATDPIPKERRTDIQRAAQGFAVRVPLTDLMHKIKRQKEERKRTIRKINQEYREDSSFKFEWGNFSGGFVIFSTRPWTEGPKSDFSFQHPGHYFFSMVLHSLRAV